jgi:hypothetical protein
LRIVAGGPDVVRPRRYILVQRLLAGTSRRRVNYERKERTMSIRRRIQSRMSSFPTLPGAAIGGSFPSHNTDEGRAILALYGGLLDLAKEVDNLTEELARVNTKLRRVA